MRPSILLFESCLRRGNEVIARSNLCLSYGERTCGVLVFLKKIHIRIAFEKAFAECLAQLLSFYFDGPTISCEVKNALDHR